MVQNVTSFECNRLSSKSCSYKTDDFVLQNASVLYPSWLMGNSSQWVYKNKRKPVWFLFSQSIVFHQWCSSKIQSRCTFYVLQFSQFRDIVSLFPFSCDKQSTLLMLWNTTIFISVFCPAPYLFSLEDTSRILLKKFS